MTLDFKQILMPSGLEVPSDETIAKRKSAFEKLSQQPDIVALSLNLVRFVFSLEFDENHINEFKQVIIEFDSEFPAKPKLFEMKILAAAVISYLIDDENSQVRILLALAVVNCFGFGLRAKPDRINITAFAEGELVNKLMVYRSFSEFKPIQVKQDLGDKKVKEFLGNPTISQSAESLQDLLKAIITSTAQTSTVINNVYDNIYRNNQILQDETDILWWLFSNSSRQLGKPWPTIQPLEACLIIGMELADLVKIMPGPRSVPQLIQKTLASCQTTPPKTATIQGILPKVSKTALKAIMEDLTLEINELIPIHYAVAKYMESSSEFTRMMLKSKIDIARRLSPETIAMQIYRERMYMKSIQGRSGE